MKQSALDVVTSLYEPYQSFRERFHQQQVLIISRGKDADKDLFLHARGSGHKEIGNRKQHPGILFWNLLRRRW